MAKAKAAKSTYSTEITTRFLLILEEVVAQGLVKNKTEFGKAVGEYQQNFSLMDKGTRAPTLDQLASACHQFGYSANWLLLGLGEKKIDPSMNEPLGQRMTAMEIQVKNILKKMATVKDK